MMSHFGRKVLWLFGSEFCVVGSIKRNQVISHVEVKGMLQSIPYNSYYTDIVYASCLQPSIARLST
jgi:hypothetical protein